MDSAANELAAVGRRDAQKIGDPFKRLRGDFHLRDAVRGVLLYPINCHRFLPPLLSTPLRLARAEMEPSNGTSNTTLAGVVIVASVFGPLVAHLKGGEADPATPAVVE